MYLKVDYLVDAKGHENPEALVESLADWLLDWANANGVQLAGSISLQEERDNGQEKESAET